MPSFMIKDYRDSGDDSELQSQNLVYGQTERFRARCTLAKHRRATHQMLLKDDDVCNATATTAEAAPRGEYRAKE